MRRLGRISCAALLLAGTALAAEPARRPSLVPMPAEVEPRDGTFTFTRKTSIQLAGERDARMRELARNASHMLRRLTGFRPRVTTSPARGQGTDLLVLELADGALEGPEGYRLEVTRSYVRIAAETHAGLFYGLETLRQLLPPRGPDERVRTIPALVIRDRPRFPYRGMHLDVGRHLFPVEFIKKYIDLLSIYKMNVFHWHLTEDQGWRIEIRKYPRLTEVGAHRRETILERNFDPYVGDGVPYGGFYTQEQVREVVDHARRRHVTVIPEIEMPGHSLAALAAYPELACTEGPFEVGTRWGVYEDIYCPKEETFTFLQDVLTEVMELFPSPYIHIGGDEAPKARWEASDAAQDVIRREGLADEHELQSYFIRRIETFLRGHGRRLIGWDEILEGGLAPDATVMSWRGTEGGIEAARQGHDVVMTPTSHVYFDYYQGDPRFEPLAIGGLTPLEKVYAFEPVPAELTAAQARHVLGAQGNVWTEYMKTADHVEYMAVPRMLALAEVVWSPRAARSWPSFVDRLGEQFRRLERLGVNYRIPPPGGLDEDQVVQGETATLVLEPPFPGATLRYTTDGSEPTAASPRYSGPITLSVDEAGVEVAARTFVGGRGSPLRRARFSAASDGRARRPGSRPPDA